MDIGRLQNRISLGMGAAARKYGSTYTVYRPSGNDQPMCDHNRLISLPVAFQPFGRSTGGGRDMAVWNATFDSHYTTEGDYLVGDREVFFVAMQRQALPVRCVLTNCAVTVVRPSLAAQGSYNGLYVTGGALIINNWPGYLDGGQSVSSNGGPFKQTNRSLLLPKLPGCIEVADVITDENGASYIVGSAEQSAMGWRVMVNAGTP